MRESAAQLIKLDISGSLDARSEMGKVIVSREWDSRADTLFRSQCSQIRDEQYIPSEVIVTKTHLYILRDAEKPGTLVIKSRRQLQTIMKISRNAKTDGVVKIQYGSKGTGGTVHITDTDKVHFPTNIHPFLEQLKKAISGL